MFSTLRTLPNPAAALLAIGLSAASLTAMACDFTDASTKISPDDDRARSTVQVGVNGIDCSGVIVPNEAKSQSLRVLTAAHCVVDWGVRQGQTFTATVSFNAITGSSKRLTRSVEFVADFVGPPLKGDTTGQYYDPDVALISSSFVSPYGTRFTSIDGTDNNFSVGTPVTTLGFPATTTAGVTRNQQIAAGPVYGYPDGGKAQSVKFNYGGSTGGSSGSPAYRDADLFLLGIVIGGPSNAAGRCGDTAAVQPLFTAWSAIGPILAPSGATVVQGYDSTAPANVPPATASLTSTSSSVQTGTPVTLSWTSTDATSCAASGDWTGTKATSGSETITLTNPNPPGGAAVTKSFTLTCSGSGGSGASTKQITVLAPTATTGGGSTGGSTSGSSSSSGGGAFGGLGGLLILLLQRRILARRKRAAR